jgi:hypothetical protein
MPSQTHVLNKDAGLEDSIVFMQKKLAAMDFHIQQQS